ncbi:PREDICTED: CKLF-like MARVEL transmembrane domain-containing protein 1 [Elephantulus edwardii]|uniref:CKLF-like MARVEL transmembrane domain-containing protein 1 n=1 Tax=Elephantulus edwardii TaxID=28737 RepID=UPI0003F074F4|nr:PREDICTED: CKLF-like MARVEL transmembrane domain-containing protein 1 [Elephantulus edwardii]
MASTSFQSTGLAYKSRSEPGSQAIRLEQNVPVSRPAKAEQPAGVPGTKPPDQPVSPVTPEPTSRYTTVSPKLERGIKKRAEGRARVPQLFRDSIKRFFFSPTGMLKVLRMGLIIGAIYCFIRAEAPEPFIAITVLELAIVIFFILIYMVTLQHLVTWLDWPLLDFMNDIITAVFLLIVAILAMQEKNRRKVFYMGGALCLAASIVCILDMVLATRKTRQILKVVLKMKTPEAPSSKTAQ